MCVAIKELSRILLVGRHRAMGWTRQQALGGRLREPGLRIGTGQQACISLLLQAQHHTQGGDTWIMDIQKGKWTKFNCCLLSTPTGQERADSPTYCNIYIAETACNLEPGSSERPGLGDMRAR